MKGLKTAVQGSDILTSNSQLYIRKSGVCKNLIMDFSRHFKWISNKKHPRFAKKKFHSIYKIFIHFISEFFNPLF